MRFEEMVPLVTGMEVELSVRVVCEERGAVLWMMVDCGRLARVPLGSRRSRAAGEESVCDREVRFALGEEPRTVAVAALRRLRGWVICCDERGDRGGEIVWSAGQEGR
jgi:hypothetical protein